jgi:hypothetical protein
MVPETEAGLDGGADSNLLIPDGSEAESAADCGSLGWADVACSECTHAHCCALESLCASITACAPLNECSTACGTDASCAMGCGVRYIDAISNYNAILNCQINSCQAQCAN